MDSLRRLVVQRHRCSRGVLVVLRWIAWVMRVLIVQALQAFIRGVGQSYVPTLSYLSYQDGECGRLDFSSTHLPAMARWADVSRGLPLPGGVVAIADLGRSAALNTPRKRVLALSDHDSRVYERWKS